MNIIRTLSAALDSNFNSGEVNCMEIKVQMRQLAANSDGHTIYSRSAAKNEEIELSSSNLYKTQDLHKDRVNLDHRVPREYTELRFMKFRKRCVHFAETLID